MAFNPRGYPVTGGTVYVGLTNCPLLIALMADLGKYEKWMVPELFNSDYTGFILTLNPVVLYYEIYPATSDKGPSFNPGNMLSTES